ncbi:hypothetical protein [Agromyces sp. SYSU T00266]|uniref:hypothetical protein n=1 Tax=Agromyces zhanjiangensis TaxID=3158562 RepID=UPI003398D8A8
MTEERFFVPFLAWLDDQQHRDDPVGTLARDNARDPVAEQYDSPTYFVQYIGQVGGVEAQQAAIKAAAEYMAWDQSAGI